MLTDRLYNYFSASGRLIFHQITLYVLRYLSYKILFISDLLVPKLLSFPIFITPHTCLIICPYNQHEFKHKHTHTHKHTLNNLSNYCSHLKKGRNKQSIKNNLCLTCRKSVPGIKVLQHSNLKLYYPWKVMFWRMHLKFSASPALVFVFSWFNFQSFFWASALLPEAQHIHLLELEVKRIREDTQTHIYTPKPKKTNKTKIVKNEIQTNTLHTLHTLC